MRLLWSAETAPGLSGLALARESGRLLAWHGRQGLFLFDGRGHRLAQRSPFADLTGACCAGDGSAFAAIGDEGRILLLTPDLSPRWERRAPHGRSVAMDSFGDRMAVADDAGGLHLFDGQGELVWRANWPRMLRFLTFVPEVAVLVGSADFGLVVCFDGQGRCVWRDAPVTHTGALSASGDGRVIVLARYSEGLCCYGLRDSRPRTLPGTVPCRLADVAYDGHTFVTTGLDDRVCVRDGDGVVVADWMPPDRPVAVALAPLADRCAVALADGTIQMLATRDY